MTTVLYSIIIYAIWSYLRYSFYAEDVSANLEEKKDAKHFTRVEDRFRTPRPILKQDIDYEYYYALKEMEEKRKV